MTPDDRDRDGLPVVPNLSVREDRATPDPTPAAQGPAPADLAGREAPNVPPPADAGLSAAEVTTLAGGDASMTEANRALSAAEGLNPDTES
jgi:hypothetical protein